jgi:thiol-disulfide isomerase/thioredoxin
MTLFDGPQTTVFGGATQWLNTEGLGPADLDGHVMLVDFWTLTCINWLRTEPYVRTWSETYRDDGLVVVGVHTPEFSFERDVDLVRQAVQDRAIDYPIVVDNDHAIWSAFDNSYWPAMYFIDRDGLVRDFHFGEGRYAGSERVIQKLLGVERDLHPVKGEGVEAEADWAHLRSPETYLGYGRGASLSSPDGVSRNESRVYKRPRRLWSNRWALTGRWTVGPEHVMLDAPGGSVAYRFHARDAHLVLSGGEHDPIRFRVSLDGQAPGPSSGLDVDTDGNGVLRDGRVYQLIRQTQGVRQRTVEITFLDAGAKAYCFTFG